eukprot:m51a1_g9956 hypothetical protein (162) ;mRNA; r:49421-50028
MPSVDINIYFKDFLPNWPTTFEGVLRTEVKMEVYKWGKYFVYVSQHGRRPISNAAVISVKKTLAKLQICMGRTDMHVVVTKAVFGSVDADMDSSGCITFELEQGVEYNIMAAKKYFLEEKWIQKLDKEAMMVHETLITSGGQRATMELLAMLTIVALCRAL